MMGTVAPWKTGRSGATSRVVALWRFVVMWRDHDDPPASTAAGWWVPPVVLLPSGGPR